MEGVLAAEGRREWRGLFRAVAPFDQEFADGRD
jgi:hypothetical protein